MCCLAVSLIPKHGLFVYLFKFLLTKIVTGQIELDYLVIRPAPFKCDMSLTYARYWSKAWTGLEVGHRGSGNSFNKAVKNCAEVRENTIASLKSAAQHGADFVEFDVQLSKDRVPVVYHDYQVCISLKRKKQLDEMDMLELPIRELTLDQLKLLKVCSNHAFLIFKIIFLILYIQVFLKVRFVQLC